MTHSGSTIKPPCIDVRTNAYISISTSDKPRTVDALMPALDTIGADEVDIDSFPDEIRFYFDDLHGATRTVKAGIEIATTLKSAFGETTRIAPTLFD